jgi:hypothetical protein
MPLFECALRSPGASVRTVGLTSGAHVVSYFLELSKPAQIWKLKMDALPYSKIFQFLHGARLVQYEQFSQLCDIQFLTELELKS